MIGPRSSTSLWLRAATCLAGLALASVVSLHAPVALADEAKAAEHFTEGSRLFERGEFRNAARAFTLAYEEEAHPAPLYNAGLAWIGAARHDHAADVLSLALSMEGLSPEQAADATAKLEDAKRALVEVDVEGVSRFATLQLDEGPVLPRDAKLHASLGAHVVTVRTRGVEEKKEISVPKLDPRVVEVRFGDAEASLSGRLIGGIALFGVTAVFGGIAIGSGVSGLAARDDLLLAIEAGDFSQNTYDLRDQAEDLQILANVSWVFAALSLAGGVALTIWEVTDTATVSATPSGANLTVRF